SFFNDTATTAIYTLSLHDALPISECRRGHQALHSRNATRRRPGAAVPGTRNCVERGGEISRGDFFAEKKCGTRTGRSGRVLPTRSEEHTSELQSRFDLVCRLLLEK